MDPGVDQRGVGVDVRAEEGDHVEVRGSGVPKLMWARCAVVHDQQLVAKRVAAGHFVPVDGSRARPDEQAVDAGLLGDVSRPGL